MIVKNILRATCALSALALSVPVSASDVSYDKMQLQKSDAASPRHPTSVAAADVTSCACPSKSTKNADSGAARGVERAEERVAPARQVTPEHPTTGINRR